MKERYPNVYGMFAPQTGEFDYNAYSRQFAGREREGLTPKQAMQLANNRVAAEMYQQAKDKVSANPTDEERLWLRQVKAQLVQDYPGYGDQPGVPKKAELPFAIAELEKAAKDDALDGTPAGVALNTYLQARTQALTVMEQGGLSPKLTGSSKAAVPVRDWLRAVGAALVREHPEFAPMWDEMLSREIYDDDPAVEVSE